MSKYQVAINIIAGLSTTLLFITQVGDINPFATKAYHEEHINSEIKPSLDFLTEDTKQDNIREAIFDIEVLHYNICTGAASPKAYNILEQHYAKYRNNSGYDHGFISMPQDKVCEIVKNNIQTRTGLGLE